MTASVVRFGLVSVVGLAIDLSTGWLLLKLAGLPLVIAAGCGFMAGAIANYALHELWTFGSGEVSARRGAQYLAVLAVVLAARLSAAAVLAKIIAPQVALVAAIGVSFLINYLLSRYLVFRIATRYKDSA
ncbi:hypothetical protein WSK_2562 [Novosphingobium sp. Rr 2-17]|uniref:GtrA family protein n=1 Tax=Novosphingobium sp. Rr 2-17 TaxID=555793 RepID=UPI00026981F9|nr:GtrA family protein [Novosphingobium sp. Rr 2-17]EIZ79017.1 hypothetical protein WSK_2562 [Novosphingobium sp. Rr 2-17]